VLKAQYILLNKYSIENHKGSTIVEKSASEHYMIYFHDHL